MAPKNKPGDKFTWKQNKGTNAWTRDYSKPYKGEEEKKAEPKKTTRKSGTTKSSLRPKARPKKESPVKSSFKGMRGSEGHGKIKVTELDGIGADMKPQQKESTGDRGRSERKGRNKTMSDVTYTTKDFVEDVKKALGRSKKSSSKSRRNSRKGKK